MQNGEKSAAGLESGEQAAPVGLAKAWLERQLDDLERNIEGMRSGLDFAKTYTPTPSGPPPLEGPGSTDYSDWEVENAWEEIWEGDPDEIFDLELRAGEMKTLLDAVRKGDLDVINHYSALERAKIQLEKEQKGMEYVGAKEASAVIKDLYRLADFDKFPSPLDGKAGSRGWRMSTRGTVGAYNSYIYFSHEGTGPKEEKLQICLDTERRRDIKRVTVMFKEGVTEFRGSYNVGKADRKAFFWVTDGVVSGQEVDDVMEGGMRRFTQTDFDRFKKSLDELYADMQEVAES
ncbi:hypothetical protein A2797_02055 [candidate division WWE3 bacterium RIFCSPHIGHO2_01_FULL_48_15]|uniref:Uncharacterized protein n=1 Tax=candidate division WWE3 bacterium RIFCSPHIGHO2_01_FULL_48_15 TaxID=1802619 RepID=A0A1F4VFR3_UNCKA|nr:MAG: hypothetical protein A2797_02055 [candidate division WWE3 bacterium RIFCSPHIGHO2_01_FULL_48_15]